MRFSDPFFLLCEKKNKNTNLQLLYECNKYISQFVYAIFVVMQCKDSSTLLSTQVLPPKIPIRSENSILMS